MNAIKEFKWLRDLSYLNAEKRLKGADYLPVVGGAHSSQCPQVGQVSPGAIAIDLAATGAASATGDLAAAAACTN